MSTPSPFGAIDPTTTTGLGNLLSLGGTGLSMYNQQNAYNGLQGALNTIGPTQLQGFNMGGPGGMSSGYNPQTGQANIGLGSLNPAFGGFAGAAGQGSNAYSAGLPSALAGSSLSTLPQALNTLGSAYGNYNAGMGAANQQLGNLGNFNTTYNNMLQAQYGQLQPQIQQQAFGLQNTLFGNGVADSTGAASGSLAAQNFGRGVGQAQSTAQLNAYQQALAQQNSAAQNYGTLSAGAGNILSNAFNNFGNTNQLISGLNTAGLNNATTAAQGAGALNTVGLNNYNAALQTGMGQATARNQSLFPYASVAQSLYGNGGAPNAAGGFSNMLTQAGSSLAGNNSGLNSIFNQLMNSGGGSVVGANGLPISTADWGSAYGDLGSSTGTQLGSDMSNILGDSGFSSAGGGAAGDGMTATALGSTNNAALAGFSTTGAGAGAGIGAADWGGAYAGLDASTNAALGADAASIAGDSAGIGAGADAAATGAGTTLGGAAALALPAAAIAGLYGLNVLDQKQSQQSPETLMGNFTRGAAANQANAASPAAALAANHGYLSPGMTAEELQQVDASQAASDRAFAQMYAGMSPAQLNSNWGIDNAIQLPAGERFGNAGGYGMGQRTGLIKKS